jgi:GST-like protein
MIESHQHATLNPAKVALFLEEAGLEHRVVPVDTRRGEQHRAEFLAINPIRASAPATSASGRIAQKACA